jgi:hypothetical protein
VSLPRRLAGIRIAALGLARGRVVRRHVDRIVGDGRGGVVDRRLVVDRLARVAVAAGIVRLHAVASRKNQA